MVFHMPQLVGEVHVYGVGVDQALGLVPQGVQFFFAVGLDVHDLGGGLLSREKMPRDSHNIFYIFVQNQLYISF